MKHPVSISAASVKTFTVNVKVLQIGTRQMTMSVFRQLPAADLVDYKTLELRGMPWGRVNYRWGDCPDREDHLHVVWQSEQSLYRYCAELEMPRALDARVRRLRNSAEALALEGFLSQALERAPTKASQGMATENWTVPVDDTLRMHLNRFHAAKPDVANNSNRDWYIQAWERHKGDSEKYLRETLAGAHERARDGEAGALIGDGPTTVAAFRMLQEKATNCRAAWIDIYDGLLDLDQLFIAV